MKIWKQMQKFSYSKEESGRETLKKKKKILQMLLKKKISKTETNKNVIFRGGKWERNQRKQTNITNDYKR